MKSLSHVRLFETPWTVAYQAPLSMGFSTVKEAKGGKVDFRMDKTGNLAVIAGKRSFEDAALVSNIKAVVAAVQAAKPANVKGTFIKSMSISSTMGVGVPVIAATDAE